MNEEVLKIQIKSFRRKKVDRKRERNQKQDESADEL